MLVHKAFKYRLYPNSEQEQALARQFGACRWVWNHFLRQRIDHYTETGQGLSYVDNCKSLTQLKRQPETVWLQEANAQSLQQTLMDLQRAYKNFFAKRARYPKFKSKRGKQAFRVPQAARLEGNHLKIPKVSPIRTVVHRPLEGRIKSVTISRTKTGKYFASILCEVETPDPEPRLPQPEIGVDLGLLDFAVTSEGEHIPHPKYLRQTEKKLRRAQRVLSRRQKGSARWEQARRRVALLHEKVANQRSDFLHKLSRRLTTENQSVCLEDLAVKNMLANRYLAKSISDSGWSEFVRQMVYKGLWYGCDVRLVDRFAPSSKRCAACGWVMDTLPLSVREWTCPKCAVVHDRDENAARNILIFGRTMIGQGLPESDAGGDGRTSAIVEAGSPPLSAGHCV